MKIIAFLVVAIALISFSSYSSAQSPARPTSISWDPAPKAEDSAGIKYTIKINPLFADRIVDGNQPYACPQLPEPLPNQTQGNEWAIVNGVSDLYELFFDYVGYDRVTVKKYKKMLDSTQTKPVQTYNFDLAPKTGKFYVYKDKEIYVTEKGKFRKMRNDETIDLYGDDYDVKIIIKN